MLLRGQYARFRVVTVWRVSSDYCFQAYECGVLVPGGGTNITSVCALRCMRQLAATVCLTHVQLARTIATYEHVTCLLRVDTQLQHLVTTPSSSPPSWSMLRKGFCVACCMRSGHTGLFATSSRAPTPCRIFCAVPAFARHLAALTDHADSLY